MFLELSFETLHHSVSEFYILTNVHILLGIDVISCVQIYVSIKNHSMPANFKLLSCVKVTLTLWGSSAENFVGDGNPVVAVKGARVSDYNGVTLRFVFFNHQNIGLVRLFSYALFIYISDCKLYFFLCNEAFFIEIHSKNQIESQNDVHLFLAYLKNKMINSKTNHLLEHCIFDRKKGVKKNWLFTKRIRIKMKRIQNTGLTLKDRPPVYTRTFELLIIIVM